MLQVFINNVNPRKEPTMAGTAVAVPVTHIQEKHSPADWQTLLEKAGQALRTGVVIEAPASDFSPLPDQPRNYFSPESQRRMADSLKGPLGQLQEGIARISPLGVDTKYQIIDGERRWRGTKTNGMPYRARIIELDDEAVPYILAAVSNFNRDGHTPTEMVRTIEHFIKLDMPWTEVARMLGHSLQWIQKLYTLKDLQPEVWDMLDQNRVKTQILPTVAAIEIARLPARQQHAMALKVLERKLTVVNVRSEVDSIERKSGRAPSRRARAPRKTWRSVFNRSGLLITHSQGLLTTLASDEITAVLEGRSDADIEQLLTQLEDSGKRIKEISDLVRQKRPLPAATAE